MASKFKKFLLYTLLSFLKPFFYRKKFFSPLSPPKKILLIKNDHLGDLLMITPLIRELCIRYPECSIDLLVKEASLPAVKNNYRLSNVICLNTPWTANPGQKRDNIFKIIETIIHLRNHDYDHIVCLQDSIQTQILALFSGHRSIIGYSNKFIKSPIYSNISENKFSSVNIVKKNLLICDLIDIENNFKKISNIAWLDQKEYPLEFFIDQTKTIAFEKLNNTLPDTYIALHPGAGSPNKMINPLKTAYICSQFIKKGYAVVLIGRGTLDKHAGKTIIEYLFKKNLSPRHGQVSFINLIEKNLALDETAFVIKKSALFISHDTGTMHLASALRAKTLAIFGPTDEKIWGPWNKNSEIFTGPRKCNKICGASNVCPSRDCLNNIDEKALIRRALDILESK